MLGKLMKYELKNGGKLMPITYLATAVIFLLAWLFQALDLPQMFLPFLFLLVLAAVACVIIPFIFIIMRYHKGVFGAEGYLTNTLPVTEGQILASRLLVGLIWVILGIAVCLLTVIGIFFIVDMQSFLEALAPLFSQFWPMLLYLGCAMLVQLLMSLSALYFSMTLANTRTFSRNNILFSVVFYFVLSMVMSFVELAGMLLVPLGVSVDPVNGQAAFVAESMLGSVLDNMQGAASSGVVVGMGSTLVDVIAAVVFLVLTWRLLKRKVLVK